MVPDCQDAAVHRRRVARLVTGQLRYVVGQQRRPHFSRRSDHQIPAVRRLRPRDQRPQRPPRNRVALGRQVVGVELVDVHRHRVERLAIGCDVPVDEVSGGLDQARLRCGHLAVDGLLEPLEFARLRIVAGDLATQHRVVRPPEVVDHDEGVHVPKVAQVTVLACLEVEDEEVGAVRALVGAGREIGHATGLIGRDADDARVLDRHDAVHLGRLGLGVVDDRIPAGVVRARLVLIGVALLGGAVDPAALADVVTRVDLGLGGKNPWR